MTILLKLLVFSSGSEKPKIGGLTNNGCVVHLQKCLFKYLVDEEKIERAYEIASSLIPDHMTEFIRGGLHSLEAAKLALEYGSRKQPELADSCIVIPESNITYWPPVPLPGKIICPSMNFSEHARETEEITAISTPEFPMAFIKLHSALVGHQWPVIIKSGVEFVDYEVEVAVVIGQRAKDVPKEQALDYVLGYSVFNDISARAIQLKEMAKGLLLAGKNFDTFAPMGPYIVTKDEVNSPGELNLSLKVNGEVRQKSNTRHMIFDIATLISYWSSIMTLEPGDIITTGTPEGIALGRKPDPKLFYLKPGDIMEAEVEGMGVLINTIKKGQG